MNPWYFIATTLLLGEIIFWIGEYFRRKYELSNEVSRKLFHVIAGSLAALWPFYMSYRYVVTVEILFVISALVSRKLGWWKWLYDVGRTSWGEIFFALGVIVAALLEPPHWIYAIAILEVAIADAAAALIGLKYGRNNSYNVFGQVKSVAGSLAFYAVSLAIVIAVALISPATMGQNTFICILILPVLTTIAENFSPFGLDNIFVPLIVIGFLSAL